MGTDKRDRDDEKGFINKRARVDNGCSSQHNSISEDQVDERSDGVTDISGTNGKYRAKSNDPTTYTNGHAHLAKYDGNECETASNIEASIKNHNTKNVDDEETSSLSDENDDMMGPSLNPIPEPVSKETPTKESPQEFTSKSKESSKTFIPVDTSNYLAMNEFYKCSYKTESAITAMAKSDNSLIITGFKNGIVKFWKRLEKDDKSKDTDGQLVCTKQFLAHPEKEIAQLLVNSDGLRLVTVAKDDKSIKIFDLISLDMIFVMKLDFLPSTCSTTSNSWFRSNNQDQILVNELNSTNMFVVHPENDEINQIKSVHKSPVQTLTYNQKDQCFISIDTRGIVEYWNLSGQLPEGIDFKMKSETDLFDLAKNKSTASCVVLTSTQKNFATISNNLLRVFDFRLGKLVNKLDIDDVDNREKLSSSSDIDTSRNVIFDTENIAIITSKLGIKIINLQTNSLVKILGFEDQKSLGINFSQVLLISRSITKYNVKQLSSENSFFEKELARKPLLIANAMDSNKLFTFNSNQDMEALRDIDLNSTRTKKQSPTINYSSVILHTTLGDIKIKLFKNLTPKTTENFVMLCKKKYYNNVVFHRIIKNFMIQTGDPLGNGTGGESIWGGHFKDEFNHNLTHAKPFMVSMANAGPNTNGSQFFITTQEAKFLDNKHTIFGEVIEGLDTVRSIEGLETDENDKPLDQVAILSTTLVV